MRRETTSKEVARTGGDEIDVFSKSRNFYYCQKIQKCIDNKPLPTSMRKGDVAELKNPLARLQATNPGARKAQAVIELYKSFNSSAKISTIGFKMMNGKEL